MVFFSSPLIIFDQLWHEVIFKQSFIVSQFINLQTQYFSKYFNDHARLLLLFSLFKIELILIAITNRLHNSYSGLIIALTAHWYSVLVRTMMMVTMMKVFYAVMQALKYRASHIIKLNRVIVVLKGRIIFIIIPLTDNENRDIGNCYYGKHWPEWLPNSICSGT